VVYPEKREEVLKTEPTRPVLVFKMPESAIIDWLKLPGVSVVTDGMPMLPDDQLTWDTPYEALPNTHPRAAGSYAKALRLARENDIPLMQVVAMTSYNSAAPLGKLGLKSMQKRGRLQEGMVADITVFDPETVTDKATYAKGTLPSEGIPYVVVNGTIVVKDSQVLKDVNPGQPIRFEPEKSRFEPITIENWAQTFYAAPMDFGGGVPGHQPGSQSPPCSARQKTPATPRRSLAIRAPGLLPPWRGSCSRTNHPAPAPSPREGENTVQLPHTLGEIRIRRLDQESGRAQAMRAVRERRAPTVPPGVSDGIECRL
jgi:hypothetical protein